jgi:hypothetical protein
VFLSWGKGKSQLRYDIFELPYLQQVFHGSGVGAFVTTLLIYAAGLLVSFIVLVAVAFVYVIMSEDDKNDQDKN